MLRVDNERCTGCGACLDACPAGAIQLVDGIAAISADLCQECEACVMACPQGAIQPLEEHVPVVEGEVVALPERQIVVQQPVAAVTPSVSRPWLSNLGMALAFMGREIVPKVTAYLLEAWERRQATTTPRGRPAAGAPQSSNMQSGGHRQRQRQRRGR